MLNSYIMYTMQTPGKYFLVLISGFPYRVPLNASIKTNILNISNTPQQYTQCNK